MVKASLKFSPRQSSLPRLAGAVALASLGVGLSACQPVSVSSGGGHGPGSGASRSPQVVATPGRSGVAEPVPHVANVTKSHSGYWLLPGGVILPNGVLTPGAVNPSVSQANIRSTICRTGFTSTIRPDESYTTGLKRTQLASGYSWHGDQSTGDYEEDHLISLELGGAPNDPRNLWPEPYAGRRGARIKDLVENKLHDEVCSGSLSLAAAQRDIAADWWAAYQRYGGESYPKVWDGQYTGPTPSNSGGGAPSGATARCKDGTYSYSKHKSGTCSGHGGVARWIDEPSS